MPRTSDDVPHRRRREPTSDEPSVPIVDDGTVRVDRDPEPGRQSGRWMSRTAAPAILLPAVVAMVGLRLVFAGFPLADIATTDSALTRFGGAAVFTAVAVIQVIVFRWLLTDRLNTRSLRALAAVELALTVGALLLFGQMWVALPALGLVDVLLLMRGRARVLLASVGVVLYMAGLAELHDGLRALIGFAEFAMATLVLHLLPRLVLTIRELDAARRELTELAVAKDRLRVARDLHDTLGQRLSVALLKLDVAKRVAVREPERYRSEIEEAQETLRAAVGETQKVVSGLRSTSLVDELDGAREVLRSAGIQTVTTVAEVRMSGQVGAVLGWVVREAATNVLRHSAAARCDIRLDRVDDRVELRVRNDRPFAGLPDGRRATGLTGLEERLRDVDGHLCVRHDEDAFEIVASVPRGSS